MLRLSLVVVVALCAAPTRVHALTCPEVRYYVNAFGEEFVRQWAKGHGYKDWQINRIRRQCIAERR